MLNTSSSLFSVNNTSTSNSWLSSKIWSYILPAVLAYPLLCTALRYQRMRHIQKKYRYGSPSHPSYSDMTDKEAQEIVQLINDHEFPAMYEKGLQFALFRTYAIPSIAELLVQTRQLTTTQHVGKRYADTGVLVGEIYGNAPSSDRGIEAFSRLNYLHGHYLRQGKITNDDMLYTLALFLAEPVRWINKYEWRQLTEIEVCAIGVFHKSMGDAMQISFERLPGSATGWKDGLQFYHELEQWSVEYETQYMVPDQRCYDTALKTRELLLVTQPKIMHGFITNLISAAMDDRMREAIMFDKPPASYRKWLDRAMEVRKCYLRHLALPRMSWQVSHYVSTQTDEKGRRHLTRYDTLPIYLKPSIWNRWNFQAMMSRIAGAPLPGDEGMYPEGFFVDDVGPKAFSGKGRAEVEATKQKLRNERTGGCPFVMSR